MAAYARVAKGRNGTDFGVVSNVATLLTIATFPTMAGGAGGTVTHFGIGYEPLGGANGLAFFGAVTPNIVVSAGVTPKLDTSTAVTQAASDAMTTAAANAFLLLFFNNTDWAVVGDAAGLQNSAAAGSLYFSLHTASPAEAGNQSTNEISYT
jgi:hypothetical protein